MSVSSRDGSEPLVLIAVATSPERARLARVLRLNSQTQLIQTGPGSAAAAGLCRAAPIGRAVGLVSAGTAAGLEPTLKPGTILLPECVAADGDRKYRVHSSWHARLCAILSDLFQIETGLLISVEDVLTDPAEKRRLHARTAAVAADMESAALAEVARRRQIPFAALRVVMDTAEDRVPDAATAALGADGHLNPLAMLRALAARPADIGALITNSIRFFYASVALGRAFGAVAARLTPPDPRSP